MRTTRTFLAKAATLLLLAMLLPVMAWADNVTEEQARQQVLEFLAGHQPANGPRRAPGTTPQVTLASKVSGLYVFNVDADGGYVIISNDDATIPILGYSDSGTFNVMDMPSNMRAWLQGYADQIAWLQTHGTQSGQRAQSRAPRRIGNHATTAISPLLGEDNDANAIKWDQGTPYNNLCPIYSGSNRAVTGCVATAMAQVMKYHGWPTAATKTIPGYTTESYVIDLTAGLPATTFDWANMKPSYSGSYTDDEATAVATLMQYCGYSVQMDYGPSSGSNTDMVAAALVNYFDYKSTTQFVSRSFYTPAKWADLIYHELANGRPVVYGGMSSGGGHEFVCDGYKYDGGDLFHINWGWSGTSDGYFVLSALDPDVQGIGGSSSTDGFNYGQDAVIGIQPSTGTGSVANITPNIINLTVNSTTPSSNPAYVNVPVNITLNITNNSDDDYDGDIYIGNKYEDNGVTQYELLAGNKYTIATGETKDIVIPFKPYAAGTFNLVLFLPNTIGSYSTNGTVLATLTVVFPTTNEYVPIYGNYCDELSRSQFIIPAANLEDMAYATLNSVTFYSTNTSVDWGDAEFDVYLGEVNETTFANATLKDWSSLDNVYAGSLSVSGGKMVITFDTPYQYMGGNLLVGINQTKEGDYAKSNWAGSNAAGASLGGYNNDIIQRNFLPTTTFDYTPGTAPAVAKPTAVTINYTGGSTAEVSWTSSESLFDIDVNGTVTENVTNPYTLSNLDFATVYTIKVRAKKGSDVSDWSAPATFTTDLSDETCSITLALTDSYGDGWNGAYIQVVDALTGVVIGTVTNTSSAGKGIAQTYTMTVPNGRDINFVWVSGNYDGECSYVVYNVSGDEIFSGGGAMSSTVTYHVNCSYAPKPKDLAVTPASTSATITWTGNDDATSNTLRYRVAKAFRYGFETAEPWAVDDFAPCTTYDGDGVSTYAFADWNFTNQNYTGACIAFQNDNDGGGSMTSHSGNAFGVMFNPGDGSTANDWFILPAITIGEDYEFSFWAREITDDYGSEVINVGIYGGTDGTFASTLAANVNISTETWTKYKYDLSAYAGQTIRLAINCVSTDIFGFMFDDIFVGNPNDDSGWTTITGVTSPYVLENLTAETDYELQIQSIYTDGASDWTETVAFTTLKHIELADAATNNSDVIDENNGKAVSVTLTGRTLYKDNEWNTICVPFNVTLANSPLAGATAKTLTDATMTGTTVSLTFGPDVDELQAGVPYIIKWDGNGTSNIVNPVFNNVSVVSSSVDDRTITKAEGHVKFIGYYDAWTINTPANDDIYYMTSGSTLKHTANERTLKACRAYFQFSEAAAARQFVLYFGNGEETGITNAIATDNADADIWYDLNGRKLKSAPAAKGMYIHNGRKVVIM